MKKVEYEGWGNAEMTDEIFMRIAEEATRLAAEDYRKAWKKLQRHPDNRHARETMREVRAFFRDSWVTAVVHPEQTISQMDAMLSNGWKTKRTYTSPRRRPKT